MSERPYPNLEDGTMLPEQEDGSELREQRLKYLGPDGHIHLESTTEGRDGDKGRTTISGQARGHQIELYKSILSQAGDVGYWGKIDGQVKHGEKIQQMYELLEKLSDDSYEEAKQKGAAALEAYHTQAQQKTTDKQLGDVIEDLLRGEE